MSKEKLSSLLIPLIILFFTLLIISVQATEWKGRLGIGMSQQFVNNIPALSFKLQRSNMFAFGGLLGVRSSDEDGGLAAGLKVYRILYDEPFLNFYSAFMLGYLTQKKDSTSKSGFQADGTLGSEFQFQGLQSIGFSFEFGFSINKLGTNFTLETTASHLIKAAVHFYL